LVLAMTPRKQYKIVWKDTPPELVEAIQKLIDEGWDPIGGAVNVIHSPTCRYWAQTMIKTRALPEHE
jgi:hypothetical protein